LYNKSGNYIVDDIIKCIERVSKIVLSKERCSGKLINLSSGVLLEDRYEDDLTEECISDIAQFIQKEGFKNILFVGCCGGGYNTFQLCEAIKKLSEEVVISVIDRNHNKISIGKLRFLMSLLLH